MQPTSEATGRKSGPPRSALAPIYVHSHKNCIVCPNFWDRAAALHNKVQYSAYFTTTERIIRTNITLPGTVVYTWHIRTRYRVPGKIYQYVVYGTWYFTGIYLPIILRLCSVGTIPEVFTPYYRTKNFCIFCTRRTFITVPGTCVSSVRHSYTYPELL